MNMNLIMKQRAVISILLLLANYIVLENVNAADAGMAFTGSSKDVVAYVNVRLNTITGTDGSPRLQSRQEKYPVLYADFGGRCEFFLKNPRQDITRGSRLSERVYFKDVTAIRAFKGVSVGSEQFGLNVYVGNKSYPVRKWTGMAALRKDISGGDCSNISDENLSYAWPVLHFKVITGRKTVEWLEADLTNIVEFTYDRRKGRLLYETILKNYKKEPSLKEERSKSFQQLKAEAQERADRRTQEQKELSSNKPDAPLLVENVEAFRANLSEGDDSHCGLVIEVKSKVVKVQTVSGVHWLKRKQLYPAGSKPCNFLNGVYQEPE
jgi:hypothetical protein